MAIMGANAQLQTTWLTSGNSANDRCFLGTTNGYPLNIKTQNGKTFTTSMYFMMDSDWNMKGCRRDDPSRFKSPVEVIAFVKKTGFLPLFSTEIPDPTKGQTKNENVVKREKKLPTIPNLPTSAIWQ